MIRILKLVILLIGFSIQVKAQSTTDSYRLYAFTRLKHEDKRICYSFKFTSNYQLNLQSYLYSVYIYDFHIVKNPEVLSHAKGQLDYVLNEKVKQKKYYSKIVSSTYLYSYDKDSIQSFLNRWDKLDNLKHFQYNLILEKNEQINLYCFRYKNCWYCFVQDNSFVLLEFKRSKKMGEEELKRILKFRLGSKCR